MFNKKSNRKKLDWNMYTSHTFRGTAATVCAEAGMSLPQIKSSTGHQSDSVVQGYIDNSMVRKPSSADAFSVSELKMRKVTDENFPKNGYNITESNCVINFHSNST